MAVSPLFTRRPFQFTRPVYGCDMRGDRWPTIFVNFNSRTLYTGATANQSQFLLHSPHYCISAVILTFLYVFTFQKLTDKRFHTFVCFLVCFYRCESPGILLPASDPHSPSCFIMHRQRPSSLHKFHPHLLLPQEHRHTHTCADVLLCSSHTPP